MKRKRKKRFIIACLGVLALAGRIIRQRVQQQKAAQLEEEKLMYTVHKGDVEVTVKVSATATLVDEQRLSFGQEGKITRVNVDVGDEVKAGDVLAELDMDVYTNAVQTAELELENARLGLQKLLTNDTSVREAQLASQISELESSLRLEEEQESILNQQLTTLYQQKQDQLTQLDRDIIVAERALSVAGSGLSADIASSTEQTQQSLTARQQTIDSLISSLRTSAGAIESVIEDIDEIFGASDQFSDQADAYIGAVATRDTATKRESERLIRASYAFLDSMRREVAGLSSQMSDDEIYRLTKGLYDESEVLMAMSDAAQNALDVSSPGLKLTETMLAGFQTTVTSAKASAGSIRTELLSLANSINSLLSERVQTDQLTTSIGELSVQYEEQVIALEKLKENRSIVEKELETMQEDHQHQRQRQQAKLETLREQISVAQKELRDVEDGADQVDIDQQNNQIRQAELRLERVRDQQDEYQIVADFDGRVRSVDISEGEQYKLDEREFIVVENPNLIELELQVSQIDIVKIKTGDPVEVTFDAYPHSPIETTITSRDVNPQPNGRGGVYYKATILLEKQDLEILAGMTAIVTVTTAQVSDVLVVPVLALISEQGKRYVLEYQGEEYVRQEVGVGLTNNFQAEIVSGLRQGAIIKGSVLDEDAFAEMGIDDSSNSPFGG